MTESLKDVLTRTAGEVGSAEPDLPAIERRGRRRRARRYGITGLVAVLAAAAVALPLYGLSGIGGSSSGSAGPGQVVRYDMGGAPQPIAAGGGAAWVSVSEVSSRGTGPTVLRRIDATTGAVTDIPGANGAVWPAAGPEGVWATCNQETCAGPGVVELDPATGDVRRTIPVGGGRVWQITTGLGSVWVTTNGTVGSVTRIDPANGEVVSSFEGRYNLVAVGGDSVWATRSEGPAEVVQLDPDTGTILSRFAFPDPCYLDGTDTQVFVESCDGGMHAGAASDELVALDARTGAVQYRIPIEGYGQMRVADGTLWIAENDPRGTQIRLLRLDPATGALQADPFVIARGSVRKGGVSLGPWPPSVFFATDGDSLWLTDFSAFQVIRLVLPLPADPDTSSTPTPPSTTAPPTPTGDAVTSSGRIDGGTLSCTVTFPSQVLTPGDLTGAVFTVRNVSGGPVSIWQGINGYAGSMVFSRDGVVLQDTSLVHVGIYGPAPMEQRLPPGERADILTDDTAVLWSGPLTVTPTCHGTALPPVTLDVAMPGAPADPSAAIATAVGSLGDAFDGCRPVTSGEWVTGTATSKDGMSRDVRCAALVVEQQGFDVVALAIVSPPDAPSVDLADLPNKIQAVPPIDVPEGSEIRLEWWVTVVTNVGVSCTTHRTVSISSDSSGYGGGRCSSGSSG